MKFCVYITLVCIFRDSIYSVRYIKYSSSQNYILKISKKFKKSFSNFLKSDKSLVPLTAATLPPHYGYGTYGYGGYPAYYGQYAASPYGLYGGYYAPV